MHILENIDRKLHKAILDFESYAFLPEDVEGLSNLKKAENLELLEKAFLQDIRYRSTRIKGQIGTGFANINGVTMNILATAIARLVDDNYEQMMRDHTKLFYDEYHISNIQRFVVSHDASMINFKYAEIIAQVLKHHGFGVSFPETATIPSYVSFTANLPPFSYGICVTSGNAGIGRCCVRMYLGDGCGLRGEFVEKLNALIERREFTFVTKRHDYDPFDFKTTVDEFLCGYTLLNRETLDVILWKERPKFLGKMLLVCFEPAVVYFLQKAFKVYNLSGLAHIYPPECQDVLKFHIKPTVYPHEVFSEVLITYADTLRCPMIGVIGPEGLSCAFAVKHRDKWRKVPPSLMMTTYLSWQMTVADFSDIHLMTNWEVDMLAFFAAASMQIRTTRFDVDSPDYVKYICRARHKSCQFENHCFFDQNGQFIIHKGSEPSAIHFVIIILGLLQKSNLLETINNLAFNLGTFSYYRTTLYFKVPDSAIEHLSKKCAVKGLKLQKTYKMMHFVPQDNVAVYVLKKELIIDIRIYFNRQPNYMKRSAIMQIIEDFFPSHRKRPYLSFAYRQSSRHLVKRVQS